MRTTVLVLLVACSLAACEVEIIHDVEESTANQVLAVLQRTGIDGEKIRAVQGSKATYTVAVPRGQAADAWKILRRENLPRPQRPGLGEVFGNTGLVPTATQERALMHHALAGELSRTLQSVAGVLEARVHLVLPARDPLAPVDAPRSAAKASVLLRVAGRSPLERKAVQELVAGSVKDLKPADVSVVVVPEVAGARRMDGVDATLGNVGPFQVAAGSRTALRLTLFAALALVALLGALVIVLLRKNRRMLQAVPAQSRTAAEDTMSRLDSSLGLIERSLGPRGTRSRITGQGPDNP